MRLLRVYIDGYRNLKNVTVDFDKESLSTVVIGENGSGKSNLIEAIVEVFRAWDLGRAKEIKFQYKVLYLIKNFLVQIESYGERPVLMVRFLDATQAKDRPDIDFPHFFATIGRDEPEFGDGYSYVLMSKQVMVDITNSTRFWPTIEKELTHAIGTGELDYVPPDFSARQIFPELVFGYYSGTSRRLEKLFDDHQARYYSVINKNQDDLEYENARIERRLFYCRPVHGVFALLAHFAKPGKKEDVAKLLSDKLGITGFHSALAHFKEPSWFNHSKWKRQRPSTVPSSRGRRSYEELEEQATDLWGAKGPAGECARALKSVAFHPLAVTGKVVDDYRSKAKTEAQLACFLRDPEALEEFAKSFGGDQDLFAALEAADISDLFREILVWVTRKDDQTGDISFSDLSDGERQLLMVLGLIRVSRGKEALFLLDEPDTHLNPAWQLTYLELIKDWTDVAADEDKCQIIMTTHNPLTIAALTKREVRVMQTLDDGQIKVSEPYADPRGLGFTSTLTEIFGLPTTLDPKTQEQIDERNRLAKMEERSEKQERMLIELNGKLDRLGFMHESRDPLYDDFLKAVHDYKYSDRPVMNQEQIEKRRLAMQALIKSLSTDQGKAH